MFVYKHEVVRIRTLLMFVYVSNCSYTNTYLFVYKQLWILTPTKFMCSYTNKMWVVYVVFCLYTNKNMIVYKQKNCLYTDNNVRIRTNSCTYTNELMFVYVKIRFSTIARIRESKLVYVQLRLFVYKLVHCSYTNCLLFVYEQLLFVYNHNRCFVYKHIFVCIQTLTCLYT